MFPPLIKRVASILSQVWYTVVPKLNVVRILFWETSHLTLLYPVIWAGDISNCDWFFSNHNLANLCVTGILRRLSATIKALCTRGLYSLSFSAEPAVNWSKNRLSIVNFSPKNTNPAVVSLACCSVTAPSVAVVYETDIILCGLSVISFFCTVSFTHCMIALSPVQPWSVINFWISEIFTSSSSPMSFWIKL